MFHCTWKHSSFGISTIKNLQISNDFVEVGRGSTTALTKSSLKETTGDHQVWLLISRLRPSRMSFNKPDDDTRPLTWMRRTIMCFLQLKLHLTVWIISKTKRYLGKEWTQKEKTKVSGMRNDGHDTFVAKTLDDERPTIVANSIADLSQLRDFSQVVPSKGEHINTSVVFEVGDLGWSKKRLQQKSVTPVESFIWQSFRSQTHLKGVQTASWK